MSNALVIIDVQVGLMAETYRRDEVLQNISSLLEQARSTDTPVIYVQHDGPKGHGLEVGTPNWHIHPAIAPQAGEPVIHKLASDSFYETPLHEELQKRGIQRLVVVGGQTEYCVDTSIRRATTFGYDVILVGDAHTTDDYEGELLTAEQRIAYLNDVVNGFRTGPAKITVKPTSEINFNK